MSAVTPADRRGPAGHAWAVTIATARAYVTRMTAYLIDILRVPIFPLLLFATWRISYGIGGQGQIEGAEISGFLLVGMIGLLTWSSSIWSSGYAIEYERSGGTAAALFLSPASRVAVIAGYGLGSFLWLLPSFVVIALLALATGARFHIADPLAALLALAAVATASLATGFAFASLFILSRRANLLANFLQVPIYFLAGFVIPREALPGWARPLSDALPVSHAIDALRAAGLRGASLAELWPTLLLAVGASAIFAVVGVLSLRSVEHAAKRTGQLDLY